MDPGPVLALLVCANASMGLARVSKWVSRWCLLLSVAQGEVEQMTECLINRGGGQPLVGRRRRTLCYDWHCNRRVGGCLGLVAGPVCDENRYWSFGLWTQMGWTHR